MKKLLIKILYPVWTTRNLFMGEMLLTVYIGLNKYKTLHFLSGLRDSFEARKKELINEAKKQREKFYL